MAALGARSPADAHARRMQRGRCPGHQLTPSGSAAQLEDTIWDTAPFGIGRVDHETSLDGIETWFAYDNAGRVTRKTTNLPNQNGAPRSYSVDLAYNGVGQLDTITYPETAPNGTGGARLSVKYGYRTNGELESVTDQTTNLQYWRATSRNARGQVHEERSGDGVRTTRDYETTRGLPFTVQIMDGTTQLDAITYDYYNSRLLKSRIQTKSPVQESYEYDDLNRLQYWKGNLGNSWQVEYKYDETGNMIGRTLTKSANENIVYSYNRTNGAGPDAITSSTLASGSYAYDSKGNRISNPDGSTISYTSFDLPQQIRDNTSAIVARFAYNAAQQRTIKEQPGASKKTVYVDGLFEHRIDNGGLSLRPVGFAPAECLFLGHDGPRT
jgi:YD repeat-containing protein